MKTKWIRSLLLLVLAGNALFAGARAQSIADIARKEREKKQQQPRTGATPVIYNNENLATGKPVQPVSAATPTPSPAGSPSTTETKTKASAGEWAAKIRQQKQVVNTLQDQVTRLQESIRYVEANAYTNGVQYNEAQRKKQEEVDKLQQRLTGEKQKLADMQEAARKDGYGNSVYDAN